MDGGEPLYVVAAAIVVDRRVLLVSKQAAPEVFYLPGGKPEPGEAPLEALARELAEELGVTLVESTPLAVVTDVAALERRPLELDVHLAVVAGRPEARAEIAVLAWARPTTPPAQPSHPQCGTTSCPTSPPGDSSTEGPRGRG